MTARRAKPTERTSLCDRALHLCCRHLRARLQVDFGEPSSPAARWLSTRGAQQLLDELSDALPGGQPPSSSTSGTELALAVRVAQLRLREAASAALARPLGQDDLAPLLEALMVAAAPNHAHAVLARMRRDISDDLLLLKPDLASAVDGWECACVGVEAQAVGEWRRAARAATFFHALSRTPPPNALMMSTCVQKRDEPLAAVFGGFLQHLALDEDEAWRNSLHKSHSLDAHARAIEALVAEMLPHGDLLHVTFDV